MCLISQRKRSPTISACTLTSGKFPAQPRDPFLFSTRPPPGQQGEVEPTFVFFEMKIGIARRCCLSLQRNRRVKSRLFQAKFRNSTLRDARRPVGVGSPVPPPRNWPQPSCTFAVHDRLVRFSAYDSSSPSFGPSARPRYASAHTAHTKLWKIIVSS